MIFLYIKLSILLFKENMMWQYFNRLFKILKGHVNKCRRALVNNPIKESFYGKRKKNN